MAASDYTDIVARFSDQFDADTLANFIASEGIPCDVAEIWDDLRAYRYGVRVQRSRIDELRQTLKLKPVANRITPAAAQILAGRLTREGVPCYVGGEHTYLFGDSAVPIRETKEPGHMVAVPEVFFGDALRVLNKKPLSDDELTELAMGTAPDPADPP
jgi:hypothetical protein